MKPRSLKYTQAFALVLLAACAQSTPVSQTSPMMPTGKGGIVVVAVGDIACDPKSLDFNQEGGTRELHHTLGTSDLASN